MLRINPKGPSHASNQAPVINNEWHNQQGQWAPIVRWLNGRKELREKELLCIATLVSCCEDDDYDDSGDDDDGDCLPVQLAGGHCRGTCCCVSPLQCGTRGN